MPFDTPDGPAVLVHNIVTPVRCAELLGVHVNSVYAWSAKRESTGFPEQLPNGTYDYPEVYDWFEQWTKNRPRYWTQEAANNDRAKIG